MALAAAYDFPMAVGDWSTDRESLVQCPQRAHPAEYIGCEKWIMIYNEDRRGVEVASRDAKTSELRLAPLNKPAPQPYPHVTRDLVRAAASSRSCRDV